MMQNDKSVNINDQHTEDSVDLRANAGWFDLDTTLIIFAGMVVLVLTGVFFSARRFDSRDTMSDASMSTQQVNGVNAAGTSGTQARVQDVYGLWRGDGVSFNFHEGGMVEIDDADGELLVGSWEWDEQNLLASVRLNGMSGEVYYLTFSWDDGLLILTSQSGNDFQAGLTLVRNG